MPTDTDKTLNGTPEPFRRPVVWGRPPVTVFRVGPLPGGSGITPRPEAPRLGAAPGILGGSMIPRAAPAPAIAPPAEPPEPQTAAPAPVPAAANPDLTVRSLPTAAPQEPVRPAAPTPVPATAPLPPMEAELATGETAGKPAGRAALYAWIAVAAVVVIALGGWIWSRSSAATSPAPDSAPTATRPAG